MEEEKVDKPTDMQSGEENSQEVDMAPTEGEPSKDVNGNHGISSGFEGSGGENRRHLPPSKNLKS